MVDTNSDPSNIDFVIPANDDATKSIDIVVSTMVKAIEEGMQERKLEVDNEAKDKKASPANQDEAQPRRTRAKKEVRKVDTNVDSDVPETKVAEETQEESSEKE